MARLFGTDGVRGVANEELTTLLAMQLGQAGAYVLTKEKEHKPTIMVGCDTRISGDMLANALMAGVCSVGANAVYVGVIPTPAVAYLTRKYKVDAGVVISASHNPVEFNGIKFFDANGYKLPDEMEDEIEALIKSNMKDVPFPTGSRVGKIKYRTDAREEYINHAVQSVPVDLTGMKVVIDAAEGASFYTSVEAIKDLGANAVYVGVIPTPAVAYLTRKYKVDAGVVISASHNPVEFNGIKFFDGEGYKLPDEMEDEIEALIKSNMKDVPFPTGSRVGKIKYRTDAREEYINHAVQSVPVDLTGMKVVIDAAEGASFYTSVEAIKDLGAEVIAIHNNPDGTNINANCGSTHMEELQARVVYEKADIGLAFDGDADRLLAVDEKGNLIDGDQIMAIVGNHMRSQGKLKNDTIVVTVMSNLGFTLMAKEQNLNIETTKVGDRYVLERMKEIDASLGGEQSGHVIFLDENTTGDGLLSALHLLQVLVDTKKPLSELSQIMTVLPQALVNAKVPNHKKDRYMEYPEIAAAIEKLNEMFAGEGRVLIRPSGTEPKVRVMIEGKDQALIDSEAKKLADLIQNTML